MTKTNPDPNATEQLEQLTELLTKLNTEPMLPATVIRVTDRVLVAKGGEHAEVELPNFKLRPGDAVMLLASTGQIMKKSEHVGTGSTALIDRIIDANFIEINTNGTKRLVLRGQLPDDIKAGQTIKIDISGTIALGLAPESKRQGEHGDIGTGVAWDDIAGQVDAKAVLRECVEGPLQYPELFKHYSKPPAKGVLLSGPPGCGKTMLGKAVATAVAALHDKPSASGFIYVKAPEILDPYVGVAEANVRQLFSRARQHFEKYGVPAVVFIDEADAILGVRGARHSHMEKTIVPMFLTEMDGMDASGAMVILATNRPDQLDPAVTREGRIDHKIHVSRPNIRDTFDLFRLYLTKMPMSSDLDETAAHATEMIYRNELQLYDIHTQSGEVLKFNFQHLNSGSMVANIVDQAATLAMRRDREQKTITGLICGDVVEAVSRVFETNRHTNHDDAIAEFAGAHQVTHVRKCHVATAQVN